MGHGLHGVPSPDGISVLQARTGKVRYSSSHLSGAKNPRILLLPLHLSLPLLILLFVILQVIAQALECEGERQEKG
jgi:hypothetical protein